MILIYRGRGWAIFLTWFGVNLLVSIIVNILGASPEYYAKHPGYIGAAQLLAAAPIYLLGKNYLRQGPSRFLEDRKSKEIVELEFKHTFFWLSADWWAWLLSAAGLGCLLAQVLLLAK